MRNRNVFTLTQSLTAIAVTTFAQTPLGTASQTLSGVPVSGGLFTVLLNGGNQLGSAAFNGQARWLQIAGRSPTGSGSFTTLSPR